MDTTNQAAAHVAAALSVSINEAERREQALSSLMALGADADTLEALARLAATGMGPAIIDTVTSTYQNRGGVSS